jgi:hypothetical protein
VGAGLVIYKEDRDSNSAFHYRDLVSLCIYQLGLRISFIAENIGTIAVGASMCHPEVRVMPLDEDKAKL